jgi:hypothetical protein
MSTVQKSGLLNSLSHSGADGASSLVSRILRSGSGSRTLPAPFMGHAVPLRVALISTSALLSEFWFLSTLYNFARVACPYNQNRNSSNVSSLTSGKYSFLFFVRPAFNMAEWAQSKPFGIMNLVPLRTVTSVCSRDFATLCLRLGLGNDAILG